MEPINQFIRETISIIDKVDEISVDNILILREMVKEVRPKISKKRFLCID